MSDEYEAKEEAIASERYIERLDDENKELRTRVAELEVMKIDAEKRWDEIAESLNSRLSTLLKASEGMEKYVMHGETCNLYHHPSNGMLPLNHGNEGFSWKCTCGLDGCLADFRALKETK